MHVVDELMTVSFSRLEPHPGLAHRVFAFRAVERICAHSQPISTANFIRPVRCIAMHSGTASLSRFEPHPGLTHRVFALIAAERIFAHSRPISTASLYSASPVHSGTASHGSNRHTRGSPTGSSLSGRLSWPSPTHANHTTSSVSVIPNSVWPSSFSIPMIWASVTTDLD